MQDYTQLTWRQRLVLAGVLRGLGRLITNSRNAAGTTSAALSRRQRRRIQAAKAGLAAVHLAGWLGREPARAERMAFSREYAALERLGLLARVNVHGGLRTTHLRLTTAGRKIAEALLSEEPADAADELLDIGDLELLPFDLPVETQGEAVAQSSSPSSPNVPQTAGTACGIEEQSSTRSAT